jgi:hypothetical protein
MNESFWLRYEFSLVQRKKIFGRVIPVEDDGLPLPRLLIGSNTNKGYKELSDKETRLYKFNYENGINNTALHYTLEYVEKNNGYRFARTFFLCNLSSNYMKNMYFSDDEDYRIADPQGKINELNAKTLLTVYRALIQTYEECSDQYLKG